MRKIADKAQNTRFNTQFKYLSVLITTLMTMGTTSTWAGIVCENSIGSTANGINAIACGMMNNATGSSSTAVGFANTANGVLSTALGTLNLAKGKFGTAMGYYNNATGVSASALGSASGDDYRDIESNESNILSVAGVKVTSTANDLLSITEINGIAVSQAELIDFLNTVRNGGNVALADHSTSVGSQNLAISTASSAFGFNNRAIGEQSSAVGNYNTAEGNYSSAHGLANIAAGHFSSAFGYGNSAVGHSSSVFGEENYAQGEASTALGIANAATGMSSSAIGSNNYAKGNGATAVGSASGDNYSNNVSNESQILSVAGVSVTASGRYQGTITKIAGNDVTTEELNDFLRRVNNGGSVAFGQNSTTVGSQNLAIGKNSSALGFYNLASGFESNAVGSYNFVNNEWSNNNWANGFGIGNIASGNAAQSFGMGNRSVGSFTSAFGVYNSAIGNRSSAFGSASGNNNLAIKYDDANTKIISLAGIPVTATTLNLDSITHINGVAVSEIQRNAFTAGLMLGGNISLGEGSSVFGSQSYATAKNSTAIGFDSIADQVNTISIGRSGAEKRLVNVANGINNTDAVNLSQLKVVDSKVTALQTQVNTLPVGGTGGVSGKSAYELAQDSGFVGTQSEWLASLKGDQGSAGAQGSQGVKGDKGDTGVQGLQGLKGDQGLSAYQVAVNNGFNGTEAQWLGSFNSSDSNVYVAVESNTAKIATKPQALGTDSIAIGAGALASAKQSISIGVGNKVTGQNSGSIGDPSVVSGQNSYSYGNNNTISGDNTFVIGNSVNTSAKNAVVLGNDSASDRDNTVSIGSLTNQRQIVYVAAGTQDTDAVNVAQLKQSNTTTLSNANSYTDSKFSNLENSFKEYGAQTEHRFKEVDQRFDRQGAMSAAMMNMAVSTSGLRSQNRIGVGAGLQGQEQAVAVGYQRMINDNTSVSLSGALNKNESSGGVGVGFS